MTAGGQPGFGAGFACLVASGSLVLAACAASPKRAEAPGEAGGETAYQSQAPSKQADQPDLAQKPGQPYGNQAQPQPGATPAAAAPPPMAPAPAPPPADYAKPPSRAAALSQASGDIASAQRELDVAAGDCQNACRALGSMDRAAGRLCSLAQSGDEQRRCGDARVRVQSARDKVRNTCGSCADVSVDRDAPIPSAR